jgi:hypothetical protein
VGYGMRMYNSGVRLIRRVSFRLHTTWQASNNAIGSAVCGWWCIGPRTKLCILSTRKHYIILRVPVNRSHNLGVSASERLTQLQLSDINVHDVYVATAFGDVSLVRRSWQKTKATCTNLFDPVRRKSRCAIGSY